MTLDPKDVDALYREKPSASDADLERLRQGEPLAYVIGHIPFLGLILSLRTHPLIPRPETEWWTEVLIQELKKREAPRVLDLCAGSGAIGLAILKHVPGAHVSFGELSPEHTELIRENLALNKIDASRADIRSGDLFAPFAGERFDVIVTNPPYIPHGRELPESVSQFEPLNALYAGSDGLDVIRRIAVEAKEHLVPGGELWVECDIENIEEAKALLDGEIRTDQYGRPRLVVSCY